jgi:DNA methylase
MSMITRRRLNGEANKLSQQDKPAHDWYRFILSFPPHLVVDYLDRFGVGPEHTVLDPFCGTGTTVVECKKRGIPSIGIEANPMAHFASSVKVDWSVDPDSLLRHAEQVADAALEELSAAGIEDDPLFFPSANGHSTNQHIQLRQLPAETAGLLLAGSISPLPLHKTLVLLDHLKSSYDERFYRHEALALAKALVTSIGNLYFGPEVGVGAQKGDTPVVSAWLSGISAMVADLRKLRDQNTTSSIIHHTDARLVMNYIKPQSVDMVITSPPYPNEKDYTRTTRLETVILGFIQNKADLQALKRGLMRSNTRNVYKWDADDEWATGYPVIQALAEQIEARRIELGKTSGFEKLYGKVTKLYFGGMARQLAALRSVLRPGARLAYVVGDQASYLQVMIRTGQHLADIARFLDYEVDDIELFRTRLSTVTKEQLREEVVLLRWTGTKGHNIYLGGHGMSDETEANELQNLNTEEVVASIPLFTPSEPDKVASEEVFKEYDHIIEHVFRQCYATTPDLKELPFTLRDVVNAAAHLSLELRNPPDVTYTYRTGRSALPNTILAQGNWAIIGDGKGKYKFIRLTRSPYVTIPEDLKIIRILDATPQIVLKYQGKDEQGVLARIRYNRLIDTFTSLTTYHLQGHFRTALPGIGQVEIDDLYIGIDIDGNGYILPVEAKSETRKDQLGVVQITNMIKFARKYFPDLKVRPIGIKVLKNTFVFLEFNDTDDVEVVATERYKRYQLYSNPV